MNSSPYFLQTSLVFAWCPFLFQDPTLHTSLGSSRLWQLLRLSLFSLTFVRGTGQVFWRMFLNWDLPDVSLIMRLGIWVLVFGRKTTEETPFSSRFIRVHTINNLMLMLITCQRSCLAGSSTVNLPFPLPFHILCLGKSHSMEATLQEWELGVAFLRVEYLHIGLELFSTGDCFFFSNYWFI